VLLGCRANGAMHVHWWAHTFTCVVRAQGLAQLGGALLTPRRGAALAASAPCSRARGCRAAARRRAAGGRAAWAPAARAAARRAPAARAGCAQSARMAWGFGSVRVRPAAHTLVPNVALLGLVGRAAQEAAAPVTRGAPRGRMRTGAALRQGAPPAPIHWVSVCWKTRRGAPLPGWASIVWAQWRGRAAL